MKTRTILCVIALTMAPTFAAAMGCGPDHREQVSSCAEGQVWNDTLATCVPGSTS